MSSAFLLFFIDKNSESTYGIIRVIFVKEVGAEIWDIKHYIVRLDRKVLAM